MFPLFTTSCIHVHHDVRHPSGGSGNCGRECCPVILLKWRLPRHLGIFYMPQIDDMGPTALLPLRRKACWRFFVDLKNPTASSGFEPANLGTKGQHATPRPPKPQYRSTVPKKTHSGYSTNDVTSPSGFSFFSSASCSLVFQARMVLMLRRYEYNVSF